MIWGPGSKKANYNEAEFELVAIDNKPHICALEVALPPQLIRSKVKKQQQQQQQQQRILDRCS